jgi:glucarate dehydratase
LRIAAIDTLTVNVPYRHREVSSQVTRDGVTDVVIRMETDDGLIGWGEACSGADVVSVAAAVRAMAPIVIGRDPFNREAIAADVYHHGLWQFRAGTANFAFAGLDMGMWDLCGRALGQPLYRLFGGLRRNSVSYFWYLSRGDADHLARECHQGLAAGYEVFYLKVGIDDAADIAMVAAVRDALGAGPRLRLDANGAWTAPQARRMLDRLADFDIDFVEQPVRDHPIGQLAELRGRTPIAVCANEGLWSEAEAYARMVGRQADVYCLSPYWVGTLAAFHRLAHVAHLEGMQVCKHTHGELGIAAAASHHVLLTLPNGVEGHQQTAQMMAGDVLAAPLPIASGPRWGVPAGPGLGITVDEDALREAADRYAVEGQYLPYGVERLGAEGRP